jgi:tetratricopeptide (TPR) repeat protein
MGVVHSALDRLTGQQVALKQVNLPSGKEGNQSISRIEIRRALAEEFSTLASLRHPNIISVLDYGFDESFQPYYTMTLLTDAQPIDDVARPLPIPQRFELLIQTLQALEYLHRRQIIHRDLKPGNILVVDRQVKVLDFGLAAAQAALDSGTKRQTVGTIPYMSPELFQGGSASKASDLYALGIVAFELLTGVHPFEGKSINWMIETIPVQGVDLTALPTDSPYTPIVKKLLAFNIKERYAEANEVIQALLAVNPLSHPIETPPIRESFLQAATFIGRERELQALLESFNQEERTTGTFWLIGGESGVGKSRLLQEIRTRLLIQAIPVWRGQGVEDGRPYHVWEQIARWLALGKEMSPLETRVLKTLVPDMMAIRQQLVGDPPPLDPQATRDRLLQTLQNLLIRQKRPFLLMLEDLHWADAESLALLTMLTNQLNHPNVMIIATYRDDAAPNLPDRFLNMIPLKLKRLGSDHISALSIAILGERGRDSHLIEFLERETGGNALFIVEVMRVLAEQSGTLEQIRGEMLPTRVRASGVQRVIRRRLEQLPVEARQHLGFAAILGREIESVVLRAYAPATDWEAWINLCADYAILEIQDGRWRFAHDKVRETVLADIAAESIKPLHRAAAEALQTAYPALSTLAARQAFHWNNAGDTAQELACCLSGGEQALRDGAPFEAMRLLNRALEIGVEETIRRASVEQLLGEANLSVGQYEPARQHNLNALQLLGRFDLHPARLPIAVTLQFSRQLLHQVTPFLPHRSPQTEAAQRDMIAARAYDKLSFIEYLANHPLGSAYSTFAALNINERYGPSPSLSRSYAHAAISIKLIRVPYLPERYLKLGESAAQGDPASHWWIGQTQAIYWFGEGNFPKVAQCLTRSRAAAEQMGNPRAEPDTYYVQTIAQYFEGNFDACLDAARKCFALDRQQGLLLSAHPTVIYEVAVGLLRQQEDALRKEIPALETVIAETQFGDYLVCLALLARLHTTLGNLQAVDRLLKLGMVDLESKIPSLFSCLLGYLTFAELALERVAAGETSYQPLCDLALKRLGQFALVYQVGNPSLYRLRGIQFYLAGRTTQAWAAWERGFRWANRLGTKYEQGLILYEMGWHTPLGDSKRTERLNDAYRIFEKTGSRLMMEKVTAEGWLTEGTEQSAVNPKN